MLHNDVFRDTFYGKWYWFHEHLSLIGMHAVHERKSQKFSSIQDVGTANKLTPAWRYTGNVIIFQYSIDFSGTDDPW